MGTSALPPVAPNPCWPDHPDQTVVRPAEEGYVTSPVPAKVSGDRPRSRVCPVKTLDFSGEVVVVTGGARGLGRVIAATFLAAGADVVVCGRHEPPADELPRATGPDGRERVAVFVTAD